MSNMKITFTHRFHQYNLECTSECNVIEGRLNYTILSITLKNVINYTKLQKRCSITPSMFGCLLKMPCLKSEK